jgi:hypothetical protein
VAVFGGLPRERNDAHQDEDSQTAPFNLVDELRPRPQGNLARGIVWADILADIAADEAARTQQRDAA